MRRKQIPVYVKIMRAVRDLTAAQQGIAPTSVEIGASIDMPASTVTCYVDRLISAGVLARRPGQGRTLAITPPPSDPVDAARRVLCDMTVGPEVARYAAARWLTIAARSASVEAAA